VTAPVASDDAAPGRRVFATQRLVVDELVAADAPIGICGVLKRPTLPEPDLGFAFLPAHRGRGHAFEAAAATLAHAREALGLGRILAITTRDDAASVAPVAGTRCSTATAP